MYSTVPYISGVSGTSNLLAPGTVYAQAQLTTARTGLNNTESNPCPFRLLCSTIKQVYRTRCTVPYLLTPLLLAWLAFLSFFFR